jgi:hypothetical protein
MEQQIAITTSHEPRRFQCRHIFTDGRRCGSISLRNEQLCYYHHTTRLPAQNPHQRKARRATFDLPHIEDRSSIQSAISQIIQRIAANDLDPRRAGLLLYALQIASLNLPKPAPSEAPEPTVDDITLDPELGPLAPTHELRHRTTTIHQSYWDHIQNRLEELEARVKHYQSEESKRRLEAQKQNSDPTSTIPTIQATAEPTTIRVPHIWRRYRQMWAFARKREPLPRNQPYSRCQAEQGREVIASSPA